MKAQDTPATLSYSEEECRIVLDQLEAVIRSPHFRNSKRCSALLETSVRNTLAGNFEKLRERHLGSELFGRAPGYDTSADPIVRVTAGEVRKRLAQYYQEESREVPVHIGLPPGNYVAELSIHFTPGFSSPVEIPALEHDEHPLVLDVVAAEVEPHPPIAIGPEVSRVPMARRWGARLAIAAAAGAIVFWGLHFVRQRDSDNAFLAAFLANAGSIPIIVGQTKDPDPAPKPGPSSLYAENRQPDRLITLGDATASMTVCSAVTTPGHRCDFSSSRLIQLPAIQHKSAIFVGAFNNPWTLRLTDPLRFHFNAGPPRQILDRQTGKVVGSVDDMMPRETITTDYAVLARFHSDVTDSLVVVVAGIGQMSTNAAAEFLASPDRMHELERMAPADWRSVNVEAILATDIINGWPGHTRVIATNFW